MCTPCKAVPGQRQRQPPPSPRTERKRQEQDGQRRSRIMQPARRRLGMLLEVIGPEIPVAGDGAGHSSKLSGAMDPRTHSFPPVVDSGVRLLILGSLPGERSLAERRYYAHPQNQFWRLISAAIDRDLKPMPYA